MTLAEYLKLAERRRMLNRNERIGQAYFNTLCDVRTDLAHQALDPFLRFVGENW